MPAVADQVVGARRGGVRRIVEAHPPVTVPVEPVLEVAGRQELRIAESARPRSPDRERVDVHAAGDLEGCPDLGIEGVLQVARPRPDPLLVTRIAVAASQAALQVLGLVGHRESGKSVEDHAPPGVAAAVRLDRDDRGTDAGGDSGAALGGLESRRAPRATGPPERGAMGAEKVAVHMVRFAAARGRQGQPLERWHEWIAERPLDPIAGDAVRHEPRLQILPATIARHVRGARCPSWRDARARPWPRARGAGDERAYREHDDPGPQPTCHATTPDASRSRITAFHAAYPHPSLLPDPMDCFP